MFVFHYYNIYADNEDDNETFAQFDNVADAKQTAYVMRKAGQEFKIFSIVSDNGKVIEFTDVTYQL